MLVEEWQARNLYINKSDLENALGIKLDGVSARKFPFKRAIDKDLLPYCSMAYFNEQQAVTLLQGGNPTYFIMGDEFYPIFTALRGAIESGEIQDGKIIPADYDYERDSLLIGHSELERWARHYGYKWDLPPYTPLLPIKTGEQLRTENIELKNNIEQLQKEVSELEEQLQANAQQQSTVDSEPVLGNAKAYDIRERETHLLIIGALSNLLAVNKQKYQKGNGGINQSAISKDIETEIIELLQPATKTRTIDTIRARIRESLNLITKAE